MSSALSSALLSSGGSSVADAGSSVLDTGSSAGSSVVDAGSSAVGSSDAEAVGSSADVFGALGSSGISDILGSIQSAMQLRDALDPLLSLF